MKPNDLISEPSAQFKSIYDDNPALCADRGRITEADTRANVIDRVLHEVLAWPRSAVSREVYAQPGFIDYLLSHGRALMVIEAKAEGESFVFPFRKHRQRYPTLASIMGDKHLRTHIEQAQKYCADNGIRYACVSNAYSYVLFRAIVEGEPWKSGRALVFYDLKDVLESFTDFWNSLSYDALRTGLLDRRFRPETAPPRHRYRPIDKMVDADSVYGRNPFTVTLRPYVDTFFGDIANQDTADILKHCYVFSRPIQTIDNDLRLVLNDHLPTFSKDARQLRLTHTSPAGDFAHELLSAAKDSPRGALVVLMGGIGSGKSTFCRRFFRVVAPELVAPAGPAALLYLDFLGAPDEPAALEAYVWQQLANEIDRTIPLCRSRQFLEQVFDSELQIVQNIYSGSHSLPDRVSSEIARLCADRRTYCEAVLSHLSRCVKLPIVVLDNVDQLKVEAQTQLFTLAHRIVTAHRGLALVVLREESFSAAHMMRHVTAYSVRPYHLSSPRFRDLLRMRIDFAVNEAQSAAQSLYATDEQRQYASIVSLFHLLRRSMLGQNNDTIRLIESIAYGNMRLALKLFNAFITSGATHIPKIVGKFNQFGGYTVPFHEFCKSVMLGDYRYYRQRRSPIANVFDVSQCDVTGHFTSLRVLNYLSSTGVGRASTDGFRDLSAMLNDFIDLFDNEQDVKSSVLRMIAIDRQLLELDSRKSDTIDGARGVRITTSGMYYLRVLSRSFSYLDLVWQDTPIADESCSDYLSRVAPEIDMVVRFERVDRFLNYLSAEESKELEGRLLTVGEPSTWGPYMPKIKEAVSREKGTIRRKLRMHPD